MSIRTRWTRIWRDDPILQRVLLNSGYLLSSNTISMGLTSVQGILAALLLEPAEYGMLGMVILFASSINRLLSFRMGEVVIKYAGHHLALEEKGKAAAIIKAAFLAEALTSIVAYGILAALAPLAARYVIKDPTVSPLIIFYGLALFVNLLFETSTAVLQLSGRYRGQAALNLAQSLLTAGWILAAYLLHGGLLDVLLAYLFGKLLYGAGMVFLAFRRLPTLLGPRWWRESLGQITNWRGILGFSLSTNISSTINMVIRDSEVLWVGFFLSTVEAGYYKFALGIMNILVMPVMPLINTTFPEISRTVARHDWKSLSSILRKTSTLALIWTAGSIAGVLLAGRWLLGLLKGGLYLPAYPAILILLAGYGFANIFFWNRPLLLSLGLPNYPVKVNGLVGAVKTALMFVFVRPFGYLAQATLLSGYFLLSIGLIARRGVNEIKKANAFALEETG
ncbi:MAG: oligosaccharide flippase family protein [Anaerolineaceae bacterium]|nr:oligosaccharide flippase family protein [Anaerolineaceae bacterium]